MQQHYCTDRSLLLVAWPDKLYRMALSNKAIVEGIKPDSKVYSIPHLKSYDVKMIS
jgi:hypothetical protein